MLLLLLSRQEILECFVVPSAIMAKPLPVITYGKGLFYKYKNPKYTTLIKIRSMTSLPNQSRLLMLQEASLEELNRFFKPLSFQERIQAFYRLYSVEEVLMSSSFGASSVFLIHWVKQFAPDQELVFINTGYHFNETLKYKDQLLEQYGIKLQELSPDPEQHQNTKRQRLWEDNANLCCQINKLAPLEPIKVLYKAWISGLMGWQSPHRAQMNIFEKQENLLKFHPLIDIEEGDYLYYRSYFNLPEHPLSAYGYASIGCLNCTVQGKGRAGRWQNEQKIECGLHKRL